MKCPICGKDLDLQNKQIGTSENGDPIFNEYAICHSCKKQWNLDKQRAKKIAAKKAAEEKAKAEAEARATEEKAKAEAAARAAEEKAKAEAAARARALVVEAAALHEVVPRTADEAVRRADEARRVVITDADETGAAVEVEFRFVEKVERALVCRRVMVQVGHFVDGRNARVKHVPERLRARDLARAEF